VGLLTAIGISVGALVGVWVYISLGIPSLDLITWAGVIAWAIFYASGGGGAGFRKSIGSVVTGNLYAAIALFAFGHIGGGTLGISIAFAIVTFFMCVQARFEPLSFIPGTFLGAGTWVGAAVAGKSGDGGAFTSASEIMITISMLAGVVFGIMSEVGYKKLLEAMPGHVVAPAASEVPQL